jgi:F0F1-type ATP synthase epsilon subunit
MSENTLHLLLRTPFEEILSEDVLAVIADTDVGQATFLPNHATITGSITAGKVVVRHANHVKEYFVRQGIFDLDHKQNLLKILAFECDELSDIEIQSVREHLKMIEHELGGNPEDLSDIRYRYLQGEKVAVEKTIAAREKK